MNASDAVLSLLKAVPYFADLDAAGLATLAKRCRPKLFHAGQQVFLEGDPCRDLYILEDGRVKFLRMNAEGREHILKVFESPADTFCIASAFSTGQHIVSAAATVETRLHLLDIDTVNSLARAHHSLGLRLVAAAGEHLTHLVGLADGLALKTVTERLARHLLDLAQGAQDCADIRLPRDRLPEDELASMLGTVRVHISRSLASLAQNGAIEVNRRFVRIHDLALLRRIAEGQ